MCPPLQISNLAMVWIYVRFVQFGIFISVPWLPLLRISGWFLFVVFADFCTGSFPLFLGPVVEVPG